MRREIMGFIAGVLVTASVTATYANTGLRLVINGVDKTSSMDVPPQIVNDRTMVPLRFVAESLGARVEWDEKTATVTVDTVSYPSANTQTNNTSNQSSANAIVAIYDAEIEKTSYTVGDTAVIKVTANKVATKVKASTTSGAILGESTDYTSDSQGNYFTLYVDLNEAGTQNIRVYAGSNSGYGTGNKSLTITVNEKEAEKSSTLSVNTITLEETKVEEGDTVSVTVKTSTNAVKVEIEDNDEDVVVTKTKTSSTSTTAYTWELTFKAEGKTGSYTYYAYAYDSSGKYVYKSFTFTIVDEDDSDEPVISSAKVDESYIEEGDWVTITVKTNAAVDYVYAKDPDGYVVDGTDSYYSKSGSTYTWKLEFRADEEGSYYVYAENADGDDVRLKVTIDFK